MRAQSRVVMSLGLITFIAAGCRSHSGKKNAENLPGIPIVGTQVAELTEEECRRKMHSLLNNPESTKIEAIPKSLRNTAFFVALSVSSGKMDAKCLDFAYGND